jgi:hypothetical protein
MTFTYVLATAIGQVRLLIPDRVVATAFFTDEEITAMLALEGANVKRATALALENMASSEAYVLKVVKLLDVTTDGAKVSDALLKRAATLRAQADFEDAGIDGGFDWAEMVLDDFSFRERVIDDALRDA